MGLFKRNKSEIEPVGEHLPDFLPISCIGDACPNFQGEPCTDTEMEWMSAGGPVEGRDPSKPPLRDEATYIIYGQRCLAGAASELVAQRVEVYKPEEVEMMRIIALTGRYGEMPVTIVNADTTLNVQTIASSE